MLDSRFAKFLSVDQSNTVSELRVDVLRRFNSYGSFNSQDAVDKSLGVDSLRSYPEPSL